MGNDISNLLSKFGAAVDGYLEIEAAIDYKEPARKPKAPKLMVEAAQPAAQVAAVAAVADAAVPAASGILPPPVVAKSVSPLQRIEPVMDPVVTSVVAPVESPLPSTPLPAPAASVLDEAFPAAPVAPAQPAAPLVEVAAPPAAAIPLVPQPPVSRVKPLVSTTAAAVMPTVVADAAVPSVLRSLLGEVTQQRQSRQAAGQSDTPASAPALLPSTPAQVIAIVSPKGGVGKTTLCSALACTLARHGRVVAIDLDPQDALQYHLGVSAATAPAAVPAADVAPDWRAAWRDGSAGTRVVTHAVLAREGEAALARQLAQDPQWLMRQLQAMQLQPGDVVLLDLPAGQTAYLDQALQAADQVVAVVTPDAGSFLALEHMRQALHGRNNCRYIVNKYDGSRTFCQDMLEVLKRWMGPRLAGVIGLDHAISEGLAYGFNPLIKAGHSPAYEQLQSISEQLHAEVAKSAHVGGRAS